MRIRDETHVGFVINSPYIKSLISLRPLPPTIVRAGPRADNHLVNIGARPCDHGATPQRRCRATETAFLDRHALLAAGSHPHTIPRSSQLHAALCHTRICPSLLSSAVDTRAPRPPPMVHCCHLRLNWLSYRRRLMRRPASHQVFRRGLRWPAVRCHGSIGAHSPLHSNPRPPFFYKRSCTP